MSVLNCSCEAQHCTNHTGACYYPAAWVVMVSGEEQHLCNHCMEDLRQFHADTIEREQPLL